jgi:hypothetical protein
MTASAQVKVTAKHCFGIVGRIAIDSQSIAAGRYGGPAQPSVSEANGWLIVWNSVSIHYGTHHIQSEGMDDVESMEKMCS